MVSRRTIGGILALVGWTLSGTAFAATDHPRALDPQVLSVARVEPAWRRPPPPPRWQREEQRWRQYSPERRAQILRRAERFQKLPPRAQERLWQEYRQSHPERP